MTDAEFEKMRKILKSTSSISSLELPALALAALAIIPGFLDEILVGASVVAFISALALGRYRLVKNRTKYKEAIEEAYSNEKITKDEYNEILKDLNTLTVEGGVGKSS